ncbi:hypothetical protein [Sphingobium baderi]|uniref:hypothetical protein n=1 Tax=Sphingobium baderi TaxID=1332080 RepID=UPI002B414694|nr:hypothetical protein [Sphingobium baderi]WRD76985.1 hypothetical protein QQ987_02250 [Sphingobium baderi]
MPLPRALPLVSVLLALSAPASARAADAVEAWTPTQTALRANAAGIALPQTVAGLSLAKSGEASNGGKGIDNYAQYLSEDGTIQATLYVYLPSYADAALAAYMTDKAVMERFGAKTRRTSYASVAAGGHPGTAIRAVYDDAADGALATAAAFVHAGRWVVKMRVTGPAERRKDVLAGLDGMIASLAFDDPETLHAAAPAKINPCPAPDSRDARLTDAAPAGAEGSGIIAIPRDGQGSLCLRGTIETAEGRYEMLQQAGVEGGAIIVPTDDMGGLIAFDPAADGTGYRLSMHALGRTDLYGVYDRVPSTRQIAAIIDGKDPQTAQAQATTAYAANGDVTVSVVRGTPR